MTIKVWINANIFLIYQVPHCSSWCSLETWVQRRNSYISPAQLQSKCTTKRFFQSPCNTCISWVYFIKNIWHYQNILLFLKSVFQHKPPLVLLEYIFIFKPKEAEYCKTGVMETSACSVWFWNYFLHRIIQLYQIFGTQGCVFLYHTARTSASEWTQTSHYSNHRLIALKDRLIMEPLYVNENVQIVSRVTDKYLNKHRKCF